MVIKMEKFTQKNYEELRANLSELHMHPGITIYKDAAENEILVNLYNWFNNNTYGFIEHIASEDSLVESIFHKIYLLVEKIRDGFFTQSEYVSALKRLSEYYDRIENTAKTFKLSDVYREKTIKEIVNEFVNYIELNKKNIDNSVIEFNKKIGQFNIQAVSDSKYLTDNKEEALNAIKHEREKFLRHVEKSKEAIDETKIKLLKNYDDLLKYHNETKEKIYKELSDIENAVDREELAHYFLEERRKLKGDLNIINILFSLILIAVMLIGYFNSNNILVLDIFCKVDINNIFLLFIIVVFVFIYLLTFLFIEILKYCFKFAIKLKKNADYSVDFYGVKELKALLTPYWCWLASTFLGMFSIFFVANTLYTKNMLEILQVKPFLFLANLPFFMILVWFTWFSSKQFSYTKQICDEYEYKYALSKSYLSYRDEAKNISLDDKDKGKYEAVIVSLLDAVIKNIATSPVKSVKPDCHTPFTEVFNSIRGTIDVVKDGKDVINK